MNYKIGEAGDGEYLVEDSYSYSSTLRDNTKWIHCAEVDDKKTDIHNSETKSIDHAKKTIRNGYNKTEINNGNSRSGSIKSDGPIDQYNGMDVKLLIGRDCINLHLNKEIELQEVTDIVCDMLGLIDNHLGLEINGKLLSTSLKLRSLTENSSIQMKVVFCIDDEVTSVIIDNEGHTEHAEETFKEFQNVSVQTKSRIQLFTRETQTPYFPFIESSTNTPHTKLVQCSASISPKDIIVQAKEYVRYDDLVKYKNEQAVMIQKCIRRFLAQKRILKMKKERDIALMKKKLQTQEMSYGKLQANIQEIMNKRPVLLQDDFAKANALLVDWLKREKIKIKNEKSGKDKLVAFRQLFNKEMECLHYIQKCRIIKKRENDYKYKLQILDVASQPTSKLYPKGYSNITENESIQKASIFKNIYTEMKRHDLNQDERMTFLNKLKDFLVSMKAPECTQEMMILIDREIQMLLLNIKKSFLEGSRKRLEELFLYFSTDPEFNPVSTKLKKQTENEPLFRCQTCKELKPLEKFNIDLLKGLTHCTACTLRKELAHSNIILTTYKQMIKQIYNDEIKRGCHEGYINLLKPTDLYYLVQRLWQGRSCLSEENDLDLLRFIRWNKNYPWSPWNCILLTENEAEIHQAIEDIDNFYGDHFIKKIENKHLQAKIKFSELEKFNEKIKTSCYDSLFSSRLKSVQESQSAFSMINPYSKKIKSNCILTEPVSDLVFAPCN